MKIMKLIIANTICSHLWNFDTSKSVNIVKWPEAIQCTHKKQQQQQPKLSEEKEEEKKHTHKHTRRAKKKSK